MSDHRKKNNNTASKTIIEGGNYNKPKILLEYPCNDIKQLHEMEQGFLNTYREKYGDSVLNQVNAYLTEEERKEKKRENDTKWFKNNPEKRKEFDANYYQNNREKIRASQNEKINCVCGGKYTRTHKTTHFGTKIHQKFIQNSQNLIQKQVSEALSVVA
jgi:hypothetical protein